MLMSKHRVLSSFRPFQGYVYPGFEAWFFGVMVRDWLFTGKSKELPGGNVLIGHPPVNCEYFEWIGLATVVAYAQTQLRVMELGAGWGRWLAAAAMLARQREIPSQLTAVEGDSGHFEFLRTVLSDNGIDPAQHRLMPVVVAGTNGQVRFLEHARPAEFYGQRIITASEAKGWSRDPAFRVLKAHAINVLRVFENTEAVDLMRVDVQGEEWRVLEPGRAALRGRVRVLEIKTFTSESHRQLRQALTADGWLEAACFEPNSLTQTKYGEIEFRAGLQIWINPNAAELLEGFNDSPGAASLHLTGNPDESSSWNEPDPAAQVVALDTSVFEQFCPWKGTVPAGFFTNYLGTMTRADYWAFSKEYSAAYNCERFESPGVPGNESIADWTVLLRSVLEAQDRFVMAALGAGWGRWLVIGAAAARQRGLPFELTGVEAEPTHFQWMQEHFRDNGIDPQQHRLIEAAAAGVSGKGWFFCGEPDAWYGQRIISDPGLAALSETCDQILYEGHAARRMRFMDLAEITANQARIDYMHMDIQGTELEFVSSRPDILDAKVKYIVIGTHSTKIEAGLRGLFRRLGWTCIFDFKMGSKVLVNEELATMGDGAQAWMNPRL